MQLTNEPPGDGQKLPHNIFGLPLPLPMPIPAHIFEPAQPGAEVVPAPEVKAKSAQEIAKEMLPQAPPVPVLFAVRPGDFRTLSFAAWFDFEGPKTRERKRAHNLAALQRLEPCVWN